MPHFSPQKTSLLVELQSTWHFLGNSSFYAELQKINNSTDSSFDNEEPSSKMIYEAIFNFLKTNSEEVLEEKLIVMRNQFKQSKDSDRLSNLVKLITEKTEVSADDLLTKRFIQKHPKLRNARMLFFSVLNNFYNVSAKELSRHVNIKIEQPQISSYIRYFNNLSEKIPEHKQCIQIYDEIIQTLKTQSHGRCNQ